MGFIDDFTNFINSITNLQKVQVEKTKAQTQKDKMKELKKQNKALKKAISTNQKIGIAGIIVTIVSVFIGYYLLVYFPINHSP